MTTKHLDMVTQTPEGVTVAKQIIIDHHIIVHHQSSVSMAISPRVDVSSLQRDPRVAYYVMTGRQWTGSSSSQALVVKCDLDSASSEKRYATEHTLPIRYW